VAGEYGNDDEAPSSMFYQDENKTGHLVIDHTVDVNLEATV
jgi:hypothetical protein